MIATVPTRWRSSADGSSASPRCSSNSTIRSPASARLIASIDTVRPTPSGATVSGSTTVSRSGTTGSSDGSDGVSGAGVETSASAMCLSLSVESGRVPIGSQPHEARRQFGNPFELGEINPGRVVGGRVVIRVQSRGQKDGRNSVLQKWPVVRAADEVLRVAVVVLLDRQMNRLIRNLRGAREIRRVGVAQQVDDVRVVRGAGSRESSIPRVVWIRNVLVAADHV